MKTINFTTVNQLIKRTFFSLLIAGFFVGLPACKKADSALPPPPPPSGGGSVNTDTTLKVVSTVPIGIAIDYAPFRNSATYRNVVIREADNVTLSYNMKHGAVVKDDGSFDFSGADELFNLATSAGLEVYGHTLAWHQNQNANYLRSLTVGPPDMTNNLLANGDFEAGSASPLFTGWSVLTGGTAVASFAAAAGNNSPRALEVTVTTPGANAYDVQAIGPAWTAVVGRQYKVMVDIKASVANGKVRLVNQTNQYQQSDITPTTSWATYIWTLAALETAPAIRLNFPAAGVYTVDNVRIYDAATGTPLTPVQMAAAVDTALSRFVRASVTRYAGKIKAWDVANETINDGSGTIRSSGPAGSDVFYWAQYLGRDYALKAFQYARAADPAALLFMNDYNLESDNRKLDSLLAYVAELRAKGAQIDGIGTQMHMSTATSQPAIDNMFRKLAATGLKVKVTELDIRINPTNIPGYTPTAAALDNQGAMYKYVVDAYFKYVPAAQRFGLTIWGVTDADSWIVTALGRTDFPLLFDAGYNKKPAYTALLQALKAYK